MIQVPRSTVNIIFKQKVNIYGRQYMINTVNIDRGASDDRMRVAGGSRLMTGTPVIRWCDYKDYLVCLYGRAARLLACMLALRCRPYQLATLR